MEAPRLPGIGEQNGQRSEHAIRQIALQLKNDYAPLVSPGLTGNPQAPTPAADDNSTSIATTEYVQTELSDYATSDDLTDAIAQEVSDRDAAIAAAAYTPAAVADGTIQSNISGSSAVPAANSISAVLDDLLGTTHGNVGYRGASAWEPLAPGTAGYFLQTQGSGANPSWIEVPQRVTSIYKTADESRSTGAAVNASADAELVLAVKANTEYIVEAMLFYTAGGGNIAAGLSVPSGGSGTLIDMSRLGNSGGTTTFTSNTTAVGIATTAGTSATSFHGYISISSTAGNATVIWNRGTASGSTVVKAGSYLKLTKIEA